MNIFKIFRKAEFAMSFAMLVFLVSCSQYESPIESNAVNRSIANREVTGTDIELINQLSIMAITPASTANNFTTYKNWIASHDGHIKYNGFFDRSDALKVMDNSLEANIAFAKANTDYTTGELNAIDNFISKITDKSSQQLFSDAINQFKSDINKLSLSSSKIAYYDDLFTAFDLLNKVDGVSYNVNAPIANSSKCLVSMIGLGLAYAALFTIEVGSFGSATVLTCVGFVWASATFGGGCK